MEVQQRRRQRSQQNRSLLLCRGPTGVLRPACEDRLAQVETAKTCRQLSYTWEHAKAALEMEVDEGRWKDGGQRLVEGGVEEMQRPKGRREGAHEQRLLEVETKAEPLEGRRQQSRRERLIPRVAHHQVLEGRR
jgi:hypothetical protein